MRSISLLLICGLAFALCGCAGYKLGPTGGNVAGEKSVQIVPFTNNTLEPRTGDALTEAMRKLIQRDGTFRLATHEPGDIVVTGAITAYTRVEETLSPTDAATADNYRITMTAHVVARDRVSDKVVFDQSVTGATLVTVGSDLQSAERQALPLVAENLARNITALLVDGSW
ncbi:MAG TPA: LptE family protein [Verrucomicrobiota bacterium]|nr:LptE family protein [Verrucomicrobiota bacterium]